MKKNKLLAVLLALAMTLSLLPTAALADGEGVTCEGGENCTTHAAAIGDEHYATLADAIAAVPTNGTETTIKMLANITGMTTAQILTIDAGQNVVLDMARHSITVASDFQGRPIVNKGTLKVTGNGTIDSTAATGYGAIRNDGEGVLIIENGTFAGHVQGDGSAIRNAATCVINGGDFTGTAAVYNEGTLTVNNGNFHSTSCSTCGAWAYCINNHGDITFNNGTVTGVQGALAIGGGSGVVNGGTFTTVSCETHTNGSSAFYAVYIAGETGGATATINGGTFTSVSKAAIHVGNDNTNGDGGINANATVFVKGGTFISKDGVNVMATGPSTGTPSIQGGTFSNNGVSRQGATGTTIADYVPSSTHAVSEADGTFTVAARDASNSEAKIGETYYDTLAHAIAAADGETVTLVNNVTLSSPVVVNKKLTLNLNGHTINNTNDIWNDANEAKAWSLISVQSGGDLTINGAGALSAKQNDCYAVDVRNGAKCVINDGIYTGNIHAVYVLEGNLTVNGGEFSVQQKDPHYPDGYVLNCYDANRAAGTASITVTGGTFHYFNPADCQAEGAHTNFVASGYQVTKSGDNWVVSRIPSTPSDGGSSTTTPSQPTTSTETKPDGSTTTTESKPDGTVTESNTSKPVTDASGNTSQTTTETTTGKEGVTESKTETVTKPDGSASSTTESTTTKPDGTKTESTTETTVNKDGSTASTTTETTTNKDGTVTESKTEATTSTVTNADGSTTETKQETTTTSTGSKTESTTVTTVNKDGSTTATTTATTTDKAGTVTESKTESTTNKNGTTTEKTTTTETKANGTVTESKTETTINKDGSSKATTTATVTKADGTKVESKTTATTSLSTNKTTGTVTETKKETTTTSDGVKSEGTTVTQIRKDGTVTSTETVKASDSTGTTATKTTTLDAKGEVTTTAEVSVSSKAVTEAAKTGVAVTIPVEVTATKSASTAPTVSVSVPKTTESVKVELPVQNVTPGTVAVIVNADGTEKIVSTSMVTENGVALKLDGSATVKLVDNAKSFTDVPETNVFYNEISSLSARNIMIGVSNEKFDLHNSVTLDQVANVAGRITGAVDVKDFNAGVAWGKDGGLKTGNVSATRGDVLKALYIAAGSPAVEDTSILTRFKDASSIPADLAAIAAWAAQNGILKGNMDGTAGLSNNVTRGQACALAGRTMGTLA